MNASSLNRQSLLSPNALLIYIALLKAALHLWANLGGLGYGYFRDEFYYMVCAERLDWGYVDHPPLAPALLAFSRLIFGSSVFAIRLLPALAGAARAIVAGLMARELGGGRFAQVLAALCAAFAPINLILDGFFSMNPFETLWWTLAAYALVRLFKDDRPQYWLWVGLILGLGLQTKHTTLVFGLGLALGLVLSPARRYFGSRWLWFGGLLSLVIFLPNLAWQVRHDFPSLEFYRNADFFKNVPASPPEVVLFQLIVNNPLAAPVWMAGVYFCLLAKDGRPYRALGWSFLFVVGLLIVTQSSRPDRAAGVYPMMFAAGAVMWERWLRPAARPALGALGAAVVSAGALFLLPLGLPVLPPGQTAQFSAALGITPPIEQGVVTTLPQYFADRFGWEEMVSAAAKVYYTLPGDERDRAVILALNYGEAGAVDILGRRYRIPSAISGHNNYYLWGPRGASGEVLITIGYPEEDLREAFEEVTLAATVTCDYCVENDVPIFVVRRIKAPIEDVWIQAKIFQ